MKQKITSEPSITFEKYFLFYVMSMQDKNIDEELRFLVNRNCVDTNMLFQLMNSEIRGELS